MTKVDPKNGNETKSDIFYHRAYSNLTSYIYFLSKNIKAFQLLLKSKFVSFMTKLNSNIGKETKSDIFNVTYSNLTSFLIGCKILKHFINFFS